MNHRLLYLLLVFNLSFLHLEAQHENDVWITGYPANEDTFDYPDTGINKIFGNTFIDFRQPPYKLTRNQKGPYIDVLSISMCDSKGDLLFVCNGYKLFNKYNKLIENGDSFGNYNWPASASVGYYGTSRIGRVQSAMVALPRPNYPNQFYLFNSHMNYDTLRIKGQDHLYNLYYSIIDMNANNGYGKVIVKEKLITKGSFNLSIAACKHANDKDWWLVFADGYYDSSKRLNKVLVKSDTIFSIPSTDTLKYSWWARGTNFSHDGRYYAYASQKGLHVYDFNRCTGKLSNMRVASYPLNTDTANAEVPCFSPNNRFIYMPMNFSMYQYDVESNFETSAVKVAETDYYREAYYYNISGFTSCQITPDKKKLIVSSAATRYYHIIDSPDKKGIACNVKLNAIHLPTISYALPHFPNYTLGADTCYTSSIQDETKQDFAIFPNPASRGIELRFNTNNYLKANVLITDMVGRIVYHQEKIVLDGKLDITTQNWSEGIYRVQVYKDKDLIHSAQLQITKP